MGATAAVGAATYIDAQSQLHAGKLNARLAKTNALLAEDQANSAERAGSILGQRRRQEGAQIRGAQKASLAANGIRLDSRLTQSLDLQSGMAAELDALEIENQAAMEAMGYRLEATSTRLRSRLDQIDSRTRAASTVVRGVADSYQTYQGIRR